MRIKSWRYGATFFEGDRAAVRRNTVTWVWVQQDAMPIQSPTAHIFDMAANHENPFANIIRGVEADVLQTLCEELLFQTATAIARDCRRSRSEVRVVLNYFASTEIVTVFKDGGYKFFKLNPKHPIYNEVIKLSKSFLLRELPRTAHAFDAVDERAL